MSGLTKKTFLNYELTPHYDAVLNHLLPSILSCILYILVFSSDVGMVFMHYKDENPVWASVTLFVMYFPAIISYMLIVSDWALWPEMDGCSLLNITWFTIKTLEHLLFPVWAIWRFAERLFWSIEAVRSKEDNDISQAISAASVSRSSELYFFLQAFLHSLPQLLVQLNILMRRDFENIEKQTVDAVILSLVFNLAKVATTVTFYQRFKSQKTAGKDYPWFKSYKYSLDLIDRPTTEEAVPIRQSTGEPAPCDSRRSSDFYLEPTTPPLARLREVQDTARQTSVLDGPKRKVYRSEPDFNIRRVAVIKGLPQDDLAGKLVSFMWWFTFLLVRVLSLSAFFYFYSIATICSVLVHIIIIIAILVYDVKSDEVKRSKVVFFGFLGLIYVFCVIEFKIKFKRAKIVYYCWFTIVYCQNFIMCMIWWFNNVDDLKNEFWFRYILYIVIFYSMISLTCMLVYLNFYKPKKIVVGEQILQ